MPGDAEVYPHSATPLADVQSMLRAAAPKPFETATPIPAAVNHSTAFHDHEQKTIFMREWICVGRADEVATPGDFLTHEIAGAPILIVRQDGGALRAFVNACAHRAARLVASAGGCAKRFTCPYHAWAYGRDGRLLRAPYMEMKDGFDASQHRLKPLHLEVWEGFVYVTLASDPAISVATALAPLRENVVGRFDMAGYRTVARRSMSWAANWKNLIENFTESYHVPMAHGKTFAQHNKPLANYHCGANSNYYGYHYAAQPSETGAGAAHPGNDRLVGEWRRMMVDFCVFPNHLVTLMPDFLWWISVQPQGVDRFQAIWGVAIPREVLDDVPEDEFEGWLSKLLDYMDTANDEDKILVEALFQGTRSPVLPAETYHPLERNLWQFARYLTRVTC